MGPPGAQYEDTFIDAGLGFNNPINKLWTEAGDIWSAPLEPKVHCLVSLGTGEATLGDFGPGLRDVGQRLIAIANETVNTRDQFYNDHRHDLVESGRYYRFEVDKGLDNVGLEEVEKAARITGATQDYIRGGRTFNEMVYCAGKILSHQPLAMPVYRDDSTSRLHDESALSAEVSRRLAPISFAHDLAKIEEDRCVGTGDW